MNASPGERAMRPACDMSGKVCMVTGADSGIGKATALGLAGLGARVVLVCRERGPGEEARSEVARAGGDGAADLMIADLSSQASVRDLAAEFKRRDGRLHVLVNNAGVLRGKRTVTADGVETTFAVNHLARFLLTGLLLKVLEASAPARIVNVCSKIGPRTELNFDDLQSEKGYTAVRAYSRSILAGVMFTYELARRLEGTGVTANCLHPGIVATGLFRKAPALHRFLFRVLGPLLSSAGKGAGTSVYLASSPEVEGASGKYFVGKAPARSPAASYDEDAAARLWEVSAKLTGMAS